MEPIFDQHGHTVGWLAYRLVYSVDGQARAFLRGDVVNSFFPSHLGWFSGGYFRGLDGGAVGWVRRARGGPPTPEPLPAEPQPFLQFAMLPPMPTLSPLRPLPSPHWSTMTWDEFLGENALRPAVDRGIPPTMADIAFLLEEAEHQQQATAPRRFAALAVAPTVN